MRAAALRGAAAGGHLRRCRSSTMSPHRLRRGALHLPARRSRQNANLFLREPLGVAKNPKKPEFLQPYHCYEDRMQASVSRAISNSSLVGMTQTLVLAPSAVMSVSTPTAA